MTLLYFCYSELEPSEFVSFVVLKNRIEAGSNKRQGEEHYSVGITVSNTVSGCKFGEIVIPYLQSLGLTASRWSVQRMPVNIGFSSYM